MDVINIPTSSNETSILNIDDLRQAGGRWLVFRVPPEGMNWGLFTIYLEDVDSIEPRLLHPEGQSFTQSAWFEIPDHIENPFLASWLCYYDDSAFGKRMKVYVVEDEQPTLLATNRVERRTWHSGPHLYEGVA